MSPAPLQIPDHVRAAFGLTGCALVPLPGDASTRRYARLVHPEHGPSLVLTDTPGTLHFENFFVIGERLAELGFSTPRVFARDRQAGVALIEDFGTNTYTRLLSEGADETELYTLAIDTLAAIQEAVPSRGLDLPDYDLDFLLNEVEIMADWFAPSTGRPLTDSEKRQHRALWQRALGDVADKRDTLVIRDFHVDNLMVLDGRTGIAACGILDFQGGMIGAEAYDLMSLLQDARRDVSEQLQDAMLKRYFQQRSGVDREAILRDYHLLGAQRHAKVAGIFHRLNTQDGKPAYLAHVPRVLRLLERALKAAGLDDLTAFYDEAMPGWRERTAISSE